MQDTGELGSSKASPEDISICVTPEETGGVAPEEMVEIQTVEQITNPNEGENSNSDEKQAMYCPEGVFPKTFGRVKVSTVVRFIALTVTLIFMIIIIVLSVIPNSPVNNAIFATLNWLGTIPLGWQISAVLVIFLVTTPMGMPVTPTNLACGFLFGFLLGLGVAVAGTMIGSVVCFIWGKTLLYDWITNKMEEHTVLKAISIAVKTKAIKLIALTHLSPILPSPLLHYTFAAVGVPLLRFLIGTLLGAIPFLVVYVYLGSVSRSLTSALGDENSSFMKEIAWLAIIMAFTLGSCLIVTWIAKREFNRVMKTLEESTQVEQPVPEVEIELQTIAIGDDEIRTALADATAVVEVSLCDEKKETHHTPKGKFLKDTPTHSDEELVETVDLCHSPGDIEKHPEVDIDTPDDLEVVIHNVEESFELLDSISVEDPSESKLPVSHFDDAVLPPEDPLRIESKFDINGEEDLCADVDLLPVGSDSVAVAMPSGTDTTIPVMECANVEVQV